jgi:poly(3-hydroxybutyrate) depolymerase
MLMLRIAPVFAVMSVLSVMAGPLAAHAQDLAKGTILDDVKCLADATESYALYLPSSYSPERRTSVLMAFHPSARGRAMVETYRAAAEQYGYIVAGSNTSRNGPWAVSLKAVQAMSQDLGQRFAIDARRVYLTGMSGGARVALQVALGTNAIAGVIASSAGFPDSEPRPTVPFAIFATAGTEDFNYLEMRMLDRRLTSPHRLAVFQGGHTLPPGDVALEAIEWLELHAMVSGARPRDEGLIDRLLDKRRHAVDSADSAATVHQLDALVADFKGLRDVSQESARVASLSKVGAIRKALAREASDDAAEQRMLDDVFEAEQRLRDPELRFESFSRLRKRLEEWARTAAQTAASPERNQARRLLSAVGAGVASRIDHAEYLKLVELYRREARQRAGG